LPANLHGDDPYLVLLQDEKMMGDPLMVVKKMRRDGQ
jgi:hypothetical protein